MTTSQRYAVAAELLLSARAETAGFPSDGQFTFYMSRISTACKDAGANASIDDIAATVYAEYEGVLAD